MNHEDAQEILATRSNMPDHFASEEDATHLYIPKGEQNDATSLQPRFFVPAGIAGPVRNHFVIASSVSANVVDRLRSVEQLKRMAGAGDEMAADALSALNGLIIN